MPTATKGQMHSEYKPGLSPMSQLQVLLLLPLPSYMILSKSLLEPETASLIGQIMSPTLGAFVRI